MIQIKNETAIIDLIHHKLIFKIISNRVFLSLNKEFDEKDYIGEDIYHLYPLALSSFGHLDYREHLIDIADINGYFSNRFLFKKWEVVKPVFQDDNFPHSRNKNEGLMIEYENESNSIRVRQYFYPYLKSETIVSYLEITNIGKEDIYLKRTMSLQLDLSGSDYEITTFTGKWAAERHITKNKINRGIFKNSSMCGASSAFNNPAILVNNDSNYILFNLIYSGNHMSLVDQNFENTTRVLIGMNDYMENIKVASNETFITPEACMTFGCSENDIRNHSHHFIKDNILKTTNFPIVFNAWEAAYFNLDKTIWPRLSSIANRVGANVFVFDDGWFSTRNDETTSLGDWDLNEDKVGSKEEIEEEFKNKKIKPGLWFEPEMISEKSKLFQNHPEYALKDPNGNYILMRHQLILDLVNPECREYITNKIDKAIKDFNPIYVKWDFNRLFSDFSSEYSYGGKYIYDYYCSLYRMANELMNRNPNVVFEGCASGGTRFDLGMLFYFSVIWTSDGTDAKERVAIQDGTSFVYPLSTQSNHVSCSPNHQTGLKSSLFDRMNVATFGQFGLELNLLKESKTTLAELSNHIKFYLKYRDLILSGDNYVYRGEGESINVYGSISEDKKEAIYLIVSYDEKYKVAKFLGLDPNKKYHLSFHKQNNADSDIFPELTGEYLETRGVVVSSLFRENDRDENELGISTRIVYIKEK